MAIPAVEVALGRVAGADRRHHRPWQQLLHRPRGLAMGSQHVSLSTDLHRHVLTHS
jgi:hypothetical protein